MLDSTMDCSFQSNYQSQFIIRQFSSMNNTDVRQLNLTLIKILQRMSKQGQLNGNLINVCINMCRQTSSQIHDLIEILVNQKQQNGGSFDFRLLRQQLFPQQQRQEEKNEVERPMDEPQRLDNFNQQANEVQEQAAQKNKLKKQQLEVNKQEIMGKIQPKSNFQLPFKLQSLSNLITKKYLADLEESVPIQPMKKLVYAQPNFRNVRIQSNYQNQIDLNNHELNDFREIAAKRFRIAKERGRKGDMMLLFNRLKDQTVNQLMNTMIEVQNQVYSIAGDSPSSSELSIVQNSQLNVQENQTNIQGQQPQGQLQAQQIPNQQRRVPSNNNQPKGQQFAQKFFNLSKRKDKIKPAYIQNQVKLSQRYEYDSPKRQTFTIYKEQANYNKKRAEYLVKK